MSLGFATISSSDIYALVNARVPAACLASTIGLEVKDDLAEVDLVIAQGKVMAVEPGGSTPPTVVVFDMKRGIVWPGFVEVHTHLDKGHIWPRKQNPDGSFSSAVQAVLEDRTANWSVTDVMRRMEFSLRCAYAHGTVAIRTHIDSACGQEDITWTIVPEIRERWADRITLQFASLTSCDLMCDPAFAAKVARIVSAAGGVLGCVTYETCESPNAVQSIRNVLREAAERGLDVDFHVDETQDPGASTLGLIAETVIEMGFSGRVIVGHCCSLTRQSSEEQRRVIELVAKAGIAVVSLPMCNMYLQERAARSTPRYRGVTLLHEFKAAGVPVMVSSDNTRDPFYAYGDLDALEVYREATRIAQLDHPVGDWPRVITSAPAEVMGLDRGVIAAGRPADLVLTRARSWTELLARPWPDRTVLRAGRPIDTTLPDYSELDDLVGAP